MTQIPAWDAAGIIPPVRPGAVGHSLDRSPYIAGALDLVARFGTSQERCAILDGWLRYREELYSAGLVTGFQWLDGSFVEDSEQYEDRAPGDIDVVTFFELPAGVDQIQFDGQHPELFDPDATKAKYLVDAYGMELGLPLDTELIADVTYWYSLWSHRRQDCRWKGFVQVDLNARADEVAAANLAIIAKELQQ